MASTGPKREGFYGWIALAGAISVFFCWGSIYYSYGVFLPPLIEEFGWSRAALSGPYSLYRIIFGVLGPLVGISIIKFGIRKNIIAGNLIIALGLIGMSLVREIWHVYLFYSVLIGIGTGFGISIVTMAMVNNWFIKRRALAMSLLFASGGVSGFIFLPLLTWIFSWVGWRSAWLYLAGLELILAVGIGGMLVRNKPEDMGQLPDGEVAQAGQETASTEPPSSRIYQTPVDWKAKDALRTRTLWMIVTFGITLTLSECILMTHQVAYIQDLGFSPTIAAIPLSLFIGASVVGRLAIGFLGGRFEGRHLAAGCLVGFAIGMIILIYSKTLAVLYLHAVVAGLSYGGLIVLRSVILGAYYGRTYYAQIIGWTAPVAILFSSSGGPLAGFIYDNTGSYILAFVIATALLGVGIVCALLARPPKPRTTVTQ